MFMENKMQRLDYRLHYKSSSFWTRFKQNLVYLPGALVIVYGFWLTLTA